MLDPACMRLKAHIFRAYAHVSLCVKTTTNSRYSHSHTGRVQLIFVYGTLPHVTSDPFWTTFLPKRLDYFLPGAGEEHSMKQTLGGYLPLIEVLVITSIDSLSMPLPVYGTASRVLLPTRVQ